MKIKLEFDCDTDEDNEEFKIIMQAKEMHCALHRIIEDELRHIRKYECFKEGKPLNGSQMEAINRFADICYKVLEAYDVTIY